MAKTVDEGITEPFEKEQFIIREMQKYGRTRDRAALKWAAHEKQGFKRDHDGDEGQMRLWLPSKCSSLMEA